MEFRKYNGQSLCVITYIKQYLIETKDLRHINGGFSIGFKPPHKAGTQTAIPRRIHVLKEAGINVSGFSAQTTRSAFSLNGSEKV